MHEKVDVETRNLETEGRQPFPTKRLYSERAYAVDRAHHTLCSTGGGHPAPTAIIGDEEIYQLQRRHQAGNPQENSWVGKYPDDWHII